MTEEIINLRSLIQSGQKLAKIDRLEQENKELLEKFKEAQDDIESLTNANNYYFKENNQMKSALEEIREIVSDEIDKTDSDDELMQIYGSILNKINEVKND